MSHQVYEIKRYLKTYVALVVLLAVTVWVAYMEFPLQILATVIALLVACTKTFLVIWNFMHLRDSTKLTQIWAFIGILFLLILFGLTMNDYVWRPDYFVEPSK